MILIIHRNFVSGQITHKIRVTSITSYPEQTHNLRIFVILIERKPNSSFASIQQLKPFDVLKFYEDVINLSQLWLWQVAFPFCKLSTIFYTFSFSFFHKLYFRTKPLFKKIQKHILLSIISQSSKIWTKLFRHKVVIKQEL